MFRIDSLKTSYETEQRDKLKCEHLFLTLSSVLTQLIPISTVPSLPACGLLCVCVGQVMPTLWETNVPARIVQTENTLLGPANGPHKDHGLINTINNG